MSGMMDNDGPARDADAQEVQIRFPNDAALQDAITQLGLAGYDRSDFSLPEDQLNSAQNALNGNAEHLSDSADGRQLRTMGSSIAGTVAAFALAGATIATGGATAVAALGAAAVGAGTLAAASAAGAAIEEGEDKAVAEERDQRGAENWLLLAVRTRSEAQVQQVTEIAHAAGATNVRPIARMEEVSTAGVSSASWTGD